MMRTWRVTARSVVCAAALGAICVGVALLPPVAEAKRMRTDKAYGTCTYVSIRTGHIEELTFSIYPSRGALQPASGYVLYHGASGSWATNVTSAAVEGRDAYFGGVMTWWTLDVPPGSDAPQLVETNVYLAVHDGGSPWGAGDTVYVTIGDLVDPAALVAARSMPPEWTVPILSGELLVIDV
jgi:hypothetical protein